MLRLTVWAMETARNLKNDNRGVTAMEYGIIAATTVVVIGAVVGGMSGSLTKIWTAINTALTTAAA